MFIRIVKSRLFNLPMNLHKTSVVFERARTSQRII